MITVLSEETGFIWDVNQRTSFGDFCNYCNVSVTLGVFGIKCKDDLPPPHTHTLAKASIKSATSGLTGRHWDILICHISYFLSDEHCTWPTNILSREFNLRSWTLLICGQHMSVPASYFTLLFVSFCILQTGTAAGHIQKFYSTLHAIGYSHTAVYLLPLYIVHIAPPLWIKEKGRCSQVWRSFLNWECTVLRLFILARTKKQKWNHTV